MAIYNPALRDYLDLAAFQVAVSQEIHTISAASPYYITLEYVPQVKSSATSVAENVWVSEVEANGLVTVEIETSPSTWESADLVESESPGALEAYAQISNSICPYSPQLRFNSAHAGRAVRVTYTGLGSVALARYVRSLQHRVIALEKVGVPVLVAQDTYHLGYFDGDGVADTTVEITASPLLLPGGSGDVEDFAGLTVDFGSGGNAETPAFSVASYWRRALIGLTYSGSAWALSVVWSDEAATRAALDSPAVVAQSVPLGYVDVQNNTTTGSVGEILDITDDNILPYAQGGGGSSGLMSYAVEVWGPPVDSERLGVPLFPGQDFTMQKATCICLDGGSGSTIIDVLDSTGTTILDGSKITVTSGVGTVKTVVLDAANFVTREFTDTDWLDVVFTSTVAGDAAHFRVTLFYTL